MSNHLDNALCAADINLSWALEHHGQFPASTRRARFEAAAEADRTDVEVRAAAPAKAAFANFDVQTRSDVAGRWLPTWGDA